jgi:hypothetical protein
VHYFRKMNAEEESKEGGNFDGELRMLKELVEG